MIVPLKAIGLICSLIHALRSLNQLVIPLTFAAVSYVPPFLSRRIASIIPLFVTVLMYSSADFSLPVGSVALPVIISTAGAMVLYQYFSAIDQKSSQFVASAA